MTNTEKMSQELVENYLEDVANAFHSYKRMAEKAIDQVSDEEFFRALDDEANSIAVIVKHLVGNMRSRWTDFLTSDGEKENRFRDSEFELFDETRESLMENWEKAWKILFASVEPLEASDFGKVITIRGEDHTIAEALNRQMTHYAYHIGQITFLAKHFRSRDWKTLSVPRNKSEEFKEFLLKRKAEGLAKSHPLDAPMEFSNE